MDQREDRERDASRRSTETAALTIVVTVMFGGLAFVLIEPTKYAIVATVLIFCAALAVRMFERQFDRG